MNTLHIMNTIASPLAVAPDSLLTAFREISPNSSDTDWNALFARAEALCDQAFAPAGQRDARADKDLHCTLYSLYAGRVAVPWDKDWKNLDDPRYDHLRHTIEVAWAADEQRSLELVLTKLPKVADFPTWAAQFCQFDRSNVTHPLFDFLCHQATHKQLREFIFQETPFDIHFGDILAMMLPGMYGAPKAEVASNFWDEMGRGSDPAMHRELRLQMTRLLHIEDTHYLDAERFCVEELRLANMYFHGVFNRSLLPQALGMMLATEMMVPGRLNRQIQGWRRLGWPDSSMTYLLEHVVVDVEHSRGWLENVIKPLLAVQPHLLGDIALGMARRLKHAAAVCDRLAVYLPTING